MKVLNEDETRVELFTRPIVLNKDLPKYKSIEEMHKDRVIPFDKFISTEPVDVDYEELKTWLDGDNGKELLAFNAGLSEKARVNIEVTYNNGTNDHIFSVRQKEPGLWEAIVSYFKKKHNIKKETKKRRKFDVVDFFKNVKFSTEDEANKYKNRLKDYVSCIGYAETVGQTALKEKLFEQFVIHKYETVLYAKGYCKVLTEANLVKFAKGCPRELSIDYISNYLRTIPFEVYEKIKEANKMEVFDNYVILHYDPSKTSTAMTNKEKKAEIDKAKDPILFGVISGSNKLYFIADWIDEMYDDLIWNTVVDFLGEKILGKDFLSEKINPF